MTENNFYGIIRAQKMIIENYKKSFVLCVEITPSKGHKMRFVIQNEKLKSFFSVRNNNDHHNNK